MGIFFRGADFAIARTIPTAKVLELLDFFPNFDRGVGVGVVAVYEWSAQKFLKMPKPHAQKSSKPNLNHRHPRPRSKNYSI